MDFTQGCIELIKEHEGFRSAPYVCPGGVDTIGYGHTAGVDEFHPPITEEIAESMLLEDLAPCKLAIDVLVKVELNQNQFDALGSLIYNIGTDAFASSTLLKILNSGDYAAAAEQFLLWIYSDGQVLQGLVKRRRAEMNLFLSA